MAEEQLWEERRPNIFSHTYFAETHTKVLNVSWDEQLNLK